MLLKTEVQTLPPDTPFNQLELIDASGQSSPISLSTTDDLLPLTVTKAIRVDASDIHIEPTSSGGRIRLRVDGRMAVVEDEITAERFHHFTNRLKVFA